MKSKQQGAALLIMMLVLVMVAMSVMVSYLDGSSVKIERDKKTAAALAEAKAALIGWSVGHATMPGALPCPDIANTGTSGACVANNYLIGRLPYKTLGLDDLRDGAGECLWYALSPSFRNTIPTSSRASYPLAQSLGVIDIKNDAMNIVASNMIAVIFSPGFSVKGQNRESASTNSICGGVNDAKNYLDTLIEINNATGNFLNGRFIFVAGSTDQFNDQLITISREDLYKPLRKRMIAESFGGYSNNPTYGLTWFYNQPISNPVHLYPYAANTVNSQQISLLEGKLPYNDLNFVVMGTWLKNNNWFSVIKYKVSADRTEVTVSIDGESSGTSVCNKNTSMTQCSSP